MSTNLKQSTKLSLYKTNPQNLLAVGVLIILGAPLILITVSEPAIGLGMLFAVPILVLCVVRPAWLFTTIYPLLVSIGQIPLSFGSITISLERLIVIIGGVGLLGGIFVTRQIKLKKVPSSVLFGVFVWLAFYTVSGVISPTTEGSTILFGYVQKIALAYLVYISINTPREFYTALRIYLFSGIVASLFTLVAYFEYDSLYIIREASFQSGQTLFESVFQGLARSGTGNAMVIWLSLLLFRQSESKRSKLLWSVLIFWFGVINLFALRRELLLTIPLGLIFLAWRNLLGKRTLTLVVSVSLLTLVIYFINVSPEWQQRLQVETIEQFSNMEDPRLNLLVRFTPAAFFNKPWLGYGPGNYASTQLLFPETLSYRSLALGGSQPHNAWSATLIEAGIFSCLGLCLFLYGLGRPFFQGDKRDESQEPILWSFAPLIFLQLLFSMFFGQALGLPVIWFWFGFLLALSGQSSANYRQVSTVE